MPLLPPGFLYYDGTKWVLDDGYGDLAGPAGVAGPTGPQGEQGPAGPDGYGSGDVTGQFPGPISVIGLTGVSGIVNFGSAISNPTISQTSLTSGTGQPLNLRAQTTSSGTGGNLILQSGAGTTAGTLQFLVGNTTAGYFDNNRLLRLGSSATSSASGFGTLNFWPGNNTFLFGHAASESFAATFLSGIASGEAALDCMNTAGGQNATTGIRLTAAGSTHPIAAFQSNGTIEQVGSSTSALVLAKRLGNSTSLGVTGRIYQSGAWAIGDNAINDTSSEAQAGLTGALINLSPATGTFTSVANQALNFNIAGAHHVQGHSEVRFDIGTALAGYFDSSKSLRLGTDLTGTTTILTSVSRPNGIPLYIYDNTNTNAAPVIAFLSGRTDSSPVLEHLNTSAGAAATSGLRLWAPGSTWAANTTWRSNGVINQMGGATSSLHFSYTRGDASTGGEMGRMYQSGAWTVGLSTGLNDTSILAQAGLTGYLLNISPITSGSVTTAANQTTIFNSAGQLNLQGNTGFNFLVGTTSAASVTSSKIITTLGRRAKVTSITGNYTVLVTDEYISVGTLIGGIAVTLPASPTTGDRYVIKDANGSASTFNISISGNGNNIDGASTYLMTINYTAITVIYNGTKWVTI